MKSLNLIIILMLTLVSFQSCEKEVYTGTPTEPVTTEYGKLFVNSDPQDARIYVDNKNSGYITPDTIDWLEDGPHVITLKQGLFGDTTFTINITEGNRLDKFIDYKSNPKFWGTIYCTSKPSGAKIYINGENTNEVTTASFTKLPGDYTVKYTYPEHRPDSISFTLYGSRKEFVSIILEDTTVWVSYKTNNSKIPSNIISSIDVDKQNNKWIGTRDKGVVKFDDKNWTNFNEKNSDIISDFVYCVKVDANNAVWIGTSSGLSVYDNGIWRNFTEDFLHKYVTDIAFGNNGDVWIATQDGLAKYSSGTWQLFNVQNSGIAGNFVTGVSVDNLGRVWLGTSNFGVSMFDGSTWKTYTVDSMKVPLVIGDEIRHIAVDKNNNVWVAHGVDYKQGIVGGLTRFDGTSWQSVTYPDVLTNYIESIFVDESNTVWLGTTAGLAEIIDLNLVMNYTTQNSQIPLGRVTGTVIDHNNRVWVATLTSGISKYKR